MTDTNVIEPNIQSSYEEGSFDHAIHVCNEIIKIANIVKTKGKKTDNLTYRKMVMEFKKLSSKFKQYSMDYNEKLGRKKD